MIAIVDYDAGNIHSVINVLKSLNVDYILADKPSMLCDAGGIILPGVGAFGHAMSSLKNAGLDTELVAQAKAGKPLLGICLGLQLLFDSSEETKGVKGLSLIGGDVTYLKAQGKKVPHIGWTSINNVSGRLLKGIDKDEYFYFVHSYGAKATNRADCSASASYGQEFDAVIERDNIYACQFHPEKSSSMGRKIISNFIDICYKK